MRHLFIINPVSRNVKNKVNEISDTIKTFFKANSHLEYDIHVTRWSRDAVGYVRRYAENSRQLVRIYAVGGTGTLFEVVNGSVGLPNVQVACYPLGAYNSFIRYFGPDNIHMFQSLKSLVFSDTIPLDLIRCQNSYGLGFCSVGLESLVAKNIEMFVQKTGMHSSLLNICALMYTMLSPSYSPQSYRVILDGADFSGEYASILIANFPYHTISTSGAIKASLDDSILDVYLLKPFPIRRALRVFKILSQKEPSELSSVVTHHKAENVKISSDSAMYINIDDAISHDTSAEFKTAHYAIDFVCPGGIPV